MRNSLSFICLAFLMSACVATKEDEPLANLPEAKCEVLGSNIPKKAKNCPDSGADPRAVRDALEAKGSVASGSSAGR